MSAIDAFAYTVVRPAQHDGSTLVLLHGTGGDEHDLIPLGRELAPHSVLIGVRGRSTAEPARRWFRRTSMTQFDQDDIRYEAAAFASFLPAVFAQEGLDSAHITFAGFSNGANFIPAVMLLHPHLVTRAVLLRPMLVLETLPVADLSDARVLLLAGEHDPYGGPYVARLDGVLRANGAQVTLKTLYAGHSLGFEDVPLAKEWLQQQNG